MVCNQERCVGSGWLCRDLGGGGGGMPGNIKREQREPSGHRPGAWLLEAVNRPCFPHLALLRDTFRSAINSGPGCSDARDRSLPLKVHNLEGERGQIYHCSSSQVHRGMHREGALEEVPTGSPEALGSLSPSSSLQLSIPTQSHKEIWPLPGRGLDLQPAELVKV